MIKHVVLFQLKDDVDAAEKQQVMEAFKAGILALPEKISCIRHIEVGFNANAKESYDVALYSEFDSLDDVKTYATHPAHVAAGSLLADAKESRSCVDFEI